MVLTLRVVLLMVPALLLPRFCSTQLSKAGAFGPEQGPCDIYAAAFTPCVAAHSTTRALLSSYSGPLYQVRRLSDGKTADIGMQSPTARDGRYADAAAHDIFCKGTLCVIEVIYDQSGKGNHLYQAAPGTFKGPAPGAFDTQPIADMAPVTIAGHKAYGVYIMPGMGLRNNDASYLPVGDEPQGIYYVVDATHYDSGCCFDYGNASTNGRAVGTGTMDTTYFGTSTVWGRGDGTGPWIMTDMEAGLFSGRDAKLNTADPSINAWRFVTAVVDGGGRNHWDLRGGDAQGGRLTTFYSGVRPDANQSGGYYPMRRQGAILLGTGGDNGNGSSGTFYEGVVTAGAPTEAATDQVQANIVAAHYDRQRVNLSRLKSFTPGSSQAVMATYTNTTGTPVNDVHVSLSLPGKGWTAVATDASASSLGRWKTVAPGESLSRTFRVTSPAVIGSGFLTANAQWINPNGTKAVDTTRESVRDVPAVKLNEIRFGTADNPTNQFIELFNASSKAVDLSNWTLIHTASQQAPVKLAELPSGSLLGPGSFYVLGLGESGLSSTTKAGGKTVLVRSTDGFKVGQTISIDAEHRVLSNVGTPAEAATTIFIPVSTGPWLTIPAGTTHIPVTNAAGFVAGEKLSIAAGDKYEIATVTAVGTAATQTMLTAAGTAGSANIKVASALQMLEGDMLTIDTGQRKELVRIAHISAAATAEAEVTLTAPLKLDHVAQVDVSDPGTGISFQPATHFAHKSGEAVQALGSGLTLDRPLQSDHALGAAIRNLSVSTGGYEEAAGPNRWFGQPLSASAGSIALMDATGNSVVDAVVYGSAQSNSSANGTITSPELAIMEGDQGKGGCIVPVNALLVGGAGTSIGRYPDGADADSNCTDFHTQTAANLATSASGHSISIKVSSVTGFFAGQALLIDNGVLQERVSVASVGTAGGTTISTATPSGVSALPVLAISGFTPGQTISVDSGVQAETAVVATLVRRGAPALILTGPLHQAHAAGAQVSGTGLALRDALVRAHRSGVPVTTDVPSPGKPNRFLSRRP